jgi:hypothetical protein
MAETLCRALSTVRIIVLPPVKITSTRKNRIDARHSTPFEPLLIHHEDVKHQCLALFLPTVHQNAHMNARRWPENAVLLTHLIKIAVVGVYYRVIL